MEPIAASDLYEQDKRERPELSFGCSVLDDAVGRLPTCGINEISGEAGAGKTQFCLSLSLQCQLPVSSGGLDGACAYITCGEGEFPIRRLSQLQSSPAFTGCTLEKIHIEQCYSPEDMTKTLRTRIPEMCENNGIRLLIIDSLAGLVRNEYEQDIVDMMDRTTFLFRLASSLKWLADIYKVCVLVINQVTSTGFESTSSASVSSGTFVDLKPALGLVWTSCVNTRIMLYRDSSNTRAVEYPSFNTGQVSGEENEVNVNIVQKGLEDENRNQLTNCQEKNQKIKYLTRSRRYISLQFSPIHPRKFCQYEITIGGIKGFCNSINDAKRTAAFASSSSSSSSSSSVNS